MMPRPKLAVQEMTTLRKSKDPLYDREDLYNNNTRILKISDPNAYHVKR